MQSGFLPEWKLVISLESRTAYSGGLDGAKGPLAIDGMDSLVNDDAETRRRPPFLSASLQPPWFLASSHCGEGKVSIICAWPRRTGWSSLAPPRGPD